MKIVTTGATGYIGENLVRQAVSSGHEVIMASRRPSITKLAWIPFDLSSNSGIQLPINTDVVIHLAATTASTSVDTDMEIHSAQRLIEAAKQAGAKLIFVSSQTASEHAPTPYGRTKWQIERLVLASGFWVIRPGQVYGGAARGLFGVLTHAVGKLPAIPAFLPAPKIQPIHVDDLVIALLNCAELNNVPPSILCIGATVPISFTVFLGAIARYRLRVFRLPVPVPVILIRLTGQVIGAGLRSRIGLDRLSSLFDLSEMNTGNDMQTLGVPVRALANGMARQGSARRRDLIRESLALLTYALRATPTSALVRRYVRCIERLRGGQSLSLPDFVLRHPAWIAMLGESGMISGSPDTEFVWRLNAAVSLAEACPQGARRFLAIGEQSGFFTSIVLMSYAAAAELFWRVLTLVAGPALRPLLRNKGHSQ